eukprot:s4708_g4.t1
MSSLECRKTFLEVVPSSSWFLVRRSQSCGIGDRFGFDEFLDTRADELLRRAAGAFEWKSVVPQFGIAKLLTFLGLA